MEYYSAKVHTEIRRSIGALLIAIVLGAIGLIMDWFGLVLLAMLLFIPAVIFAARGADQMEVENQSWRKANGYGRKH